MAIVAQQSYEDGDQLYSDRTALRREEEDYRQSRLSLASVYSRSISRRVYMKAGFQLAGISYKFRRDTINAEQTFTPKIDGAGNTMLFQPFIQWQFTPLPRWTFNAGLHVLDFGLTQSFSPEPRLGLRYALGENQSLGIAYGLHSMYVPPGSYFSVVGGEKPNLHLDLIKAHHFVLSYDRMFAGQFRLHGELYYQHLFDVPVGVDAPRTYWLFNTIEGYADRELVSEGKGNNYGLDVLFEKYFRQGAFFLLSGSVFNSTFQPLNGKTYNTQYNSRLTGSFTAGKEWEFKSRNSSLQLGLRTMYNHGMASTPLLDLTAPTSRPVFNESHPFSERPPAYFRIDTRVAFRKNTPKASWLLALDVQNVTNRKDKRAFNWNYDTVQKVWYRKNQAGVIPVLSFQIDF